MGAPLIGKMLKMQHFEDASNVRSRSPRCRGFPLPQHPGLWGDTGGCSPVTQPRGGTRVRGGHMEPWLSCGHGISGAGHVQHPDAFWV